MFVTLNIYIIASVDNNTTVTNSRSLNVEYTDAEKELSLSPNSQKKNIRSMQNCDISMH